MGGGTATFTTTARNMKGNELDPYPVDEAEKFVAVIRTRAVALVAELGDEIRGTSRVVPVGFGSVEVPEGGGSGRKCRTTGCLHPHRPVKRGCCPKRLKRFPSLRIHGGILVVGAFRGVVVEEPSHLIQTAATGTTPLGIPVLEHDLR